MEQAVRSAPIGVGPFDLDLSTQLQRVGRFDPTVRFGAGRLEKCFEGPLGVVRVVLLADRGVLTLEAAGAGARELVESWTSLLPPDDGRDAFAPEHPLLARLHQRFRSLRLLAVPWLFDMAASVILQQRVTWESAARSFRRIAEVHGARGDLGLAFPSARVVAGLPTWELERLGVDVKRARALVALAREQVRRPWLTLGAPRDVLRQRLLTIPGVGPWTTEMVLGFGAGDPDAVIPGDLHLPHLVSWALAREPRGSDQRMLELLEPFRGHRFRVTRLLNAARIRVPPR